MLAHLPRQILYHLCLCPSSCANLVKVPVGTMDVYNSHDKISKASQTYVHVLSLCHLYPLPVT
jgi:hypothetical protein